MKKEKKKKILELLERYLSELLEKDLFRKKDLQKEFFPHLH